MERIPVPPGIRVYELNICEAVPDHELCPGVSTLIAGEIKLGGVACTCACHRKVDTKPN
jgi:hypothetical protein